MPLLVSVVSSRGFWLWDPFCLAKWPRNILSVWSDRLSSWLVVTWDVPLMQALLSFYSGLENQISLVASDISNIYVSIPKASLEPPGSGSFIVRCLECSQLGFLDSKTQTLWLKQNGEGKAEERAPERTAAKEVSGGPSAGSLGTPHWHDPAPTISHPRVTLQDSQPSLIGTPTRTAYSGREDELPNGKLGRYHLTERTWVVGRWRLPCPLSIPVIRARTKWV